jgi:hypothetical protein
VRTFYDSGFLGLLLMLTFLTFVLWPRRELQTSPGDLAPLARGLVFGGLVLGAAYLVTDSTLLIWPWILFGLVRAAQVLAVRQARELRLAGPSTNGFASGNGNGHGPAPNWNGRLTAAASNAPPEAVLGPDWTAPRGRPGPSGLRA